MDPNRWPEFVWIVIAAGFACFISSVLLFLWGAVFRRRRSGWLSDTALLGGSGFVLVISMMAYFMFVQGRLAKEWQRPVGYVAMGAVAIAVMRLSGWVMKRSKSKM
jgi:hypothetical protein